MSTNSILQCKPKTQRYILPCCSFRYLSEPLVVAFDFNGGIYVEFDDTYQAPKSRFQRNLGSGQRRVILVCGALLWLERNAGTCIKKSTGHRDSVLVPLDCRGEDMGYVVV